MFYKPVTKGGNAAITCSTTSGAWVYSDVIDLSGKKYDERNISLALIYASAGVTPYLQLACQAAPTRGATFRLVGSGSSVIFRNTTTGSIIGDNKYYFPILYQYGGSTYQLTNPGCIKLGYRQRVKATAVTFTAQVVIG